MSNPKWKLVVADPDDQVTGEWHELSVKLSDGEHISLTKTTIPDLHWILVTKEDQWLAPKRIKTDHQAKAWAFKILFNICADRIRKAEKL